MHGFMNASLALECVNALCNPAVRDQNDGNGRDNIFGAEHAFELFGVG